MGKSVYEMVTDKIIKPLEKGVIPWEKPSNIFWEKHNCKRK